MLRLSYSAVTTYRGCEQEYYYRYVKYLRRKDKAPQLGIGTALHSYLERYYKALTSSVSLGLSAEDSHAEALKVVGDFYRPLFHRYAEASYVAGDEELAIKFDKMCDKVLSICERYHRTRGREDAERYDVLFCERKSLISLSPTIINSGVIDLVTLDKDTNRILLWEHKSGETIPDNDRRLKDLQTLLYVRIAELDLDVKINEVVWNYMRTKEPTVPAELKAGGLTKRNDLDSTWETYQKAIDERGLNEADYQEVKDRLQNAEYNNFFPRYVLPIVQQDAVLIGDYIRTARLMEKRVWEWETDRDTPIRNIGFKCDFCSFNPLCKSVVTAGDDRDVLRLRYTTEKEEQLNDNTIIPTFAVTAV